MGTSYKRDVISARDVIMMTFKLTVLTSVSCRWQGAYLKKKVASSDMKVRIDNSSIISQGWVARYIFSHPEIKENCFYYLANERERERKSSYPPQVV